MIIILLCGSNRYDPLTRLTRYCCINVFFIYPTLVTNTAVFIWKLPVCCTQVVRHLLVCVHSKHQGYQHSTISAPQQEQLPRPHPHLLLSPARRHRSRNRIHLRMSCLLEHPQHLWSQHNHPLTQRQHKSLIQLPNLVKEFECVFFFLDILFTPGSTCLCMM